MDLNTPCINNTVLEETFYILSKKNAIYRVKLCEKGLSMVKECNGNTKMGTVSIRDIIGCRCMRSKRYNQKCTWHPISKSKSKNHKPVEDVNVEWDENDISAYLKVYAYVLKKSKLSKITKKRERMVITLRFRSFDIYEENMKEAQKWRLTIKYFMETQLRPHLPSCYFKNNNLIKIENKILVIINPKSGIGKAREIFQNKVVPIFTEADINYDVHMTRHAQDARSVIRTQNLWQYMGGIVVLGGDGILFEVINGLMERPDWENLLADLKFGIVPCGSGNGLAKSISYAFNEPHDYNPVLTSALNIAHGVPASMDLVRVETNNSVYFSFLSVGWGLLSDIDIESERLRAIGSPRFTLWSLARLIGLRSYKATLSYLPLDKENNIILSSLEDIEDLDDESRSRRDSFYSIGSRKSTYLSAVGSSYESLTEDIVKTFGPESNLPPLNTPVPNNWISLTDEFVMIHAAYQTHLAQDVFFVPSGKLDDGCIWLGIIRSGISRAHLLQFLLGLSNGNHVTVPEMQLIPVQAFRIEPHTTGSHLVIDGEPVEKGPVQAEILPSIAKVFARNTSD